jgi:hypothetical protein
MEQINDQTEPGRSQNLYKITYVPTQVTQTKTCYVVADSLEEAASIPQKRMGTGFPIIILDVSIEASGDSVLNHVSPKLYIAQ